jgi:hypothetical protein
MRRCLLILLLLPLLLTAACQQNTANQPSARVTSTIALPPNNYVWVVWFDNWFVVEKRGAVTIIADLWRLPLDGSTIEKLELPKHPGCERNARYSYGVPSRLPDGRLGYITRCDVLDNSHTVHSFMIAYDLDSGEVEHLPSYEFPSFSYWSIDAFWNPDMTQGIAFSDNLLESWVFGFDLEQWEPLDLGLSQVRGMDWSPDGTQIAFIAAPEQGLYGPSKLYATFNLYLMNPDGTNLRPIASSLKDARFVVWSPDGRWLLYVAEINGVRGLWLHHLATGRQQLVTTKQGGKPSWSPDGRSVSLIHDLETASTVESRSNQPSHPAIHLYDLTPLLDE